jgi:hypothetical protein
MYSIHRPSIHVPILLDEYILRLTSLETLERETQSLTCVEELLNLGVFKYRSTVFQSNYIGVF